MSLSEKLKALAERARTSMDVLETEEATKNALVMPFIAALGYDVFNPVEVVPEFTADVGTKKGEKVDYAVTKGDEIIMLFEAKKAGQDLSTAHAGQLFRYFSVTSARLGVLTNGHQYRFFSDLEAPNKMDEKPFLELDLLDLRDGTVRRVEKLAKNAFDLDDVLSTASDLKYLGEVRRLVEEQLATPEEEFVRFFFSRVLPNSRFMPAAKEQFTVLVRQAFNDLISDKVSQRLRSALEHEDESREQSDAPDEQRSGVETDDGVETTEDELEGFRTVRAIVCNVVPVDRVVMRDSKSYCAILLDDNNRKPICRLHFNRTQKYVGLLDDEKKETRHAIERIEDLYSHADALRAAATRYAADT